MGGCMPERRDGALRAQVWGNAADGVAYARLVAGAEPSAVVCSTNEALSAMRPGDCFMSGRDMVISGDGVAYGRLLLDAAYMCRGSAEFVRRIAPQSLKMSADSYWYTSATLLLRDVYDCAAYSVARNAGDSMSALVLRNLESCVVPKAAGNGKDAPPLASPSLSSMFPEKYVRRFVALVERNAPTTGGCIVSMANSYVSPLDCDCFMTSNREVPGEGTIYVLADTFEEPFSACLAAASTERETIVSLDAFSSDALSAIAPRNTNLVFISSGNDSREATTAFLRKTRANREIFLPGKHSRFDELISESPSRASSCRKLPVEEPHLLAYDERIIFSEGEFFFERGGMEFELPAVENTVEECDAKGDDWLNSYAEDAEGVGVGEDEFSFIEFFERCKELEERERKPSVSASEQEEEEEEEW